MKPINFWIMPFSLSLLLVGCGSYSASFDCPIGEGLKCASLTEVNQKLDEGALNLGFPSASSQASCPSCQKVYWRHDLEQSQRHPPHKGY